MFLAVVAFFYIARPSFLIIRRKDDTPDAIEEINMWLTFIIALAISLISTILYACYHVKYF